jgi:hypothetical protein
MEGKNFFEKSAALMAALTNSLAGCNASVGARLFNIAVYLLVQKNIR